MSFGTTGAAEDASPAKADIAASGASSRAVKSVLVRFRLVSFVFMIVSFSYFVENEKLFIAARSIRCDAADLQMPDLGTAGVEAERNIGRRRAFVGKQQCRGVPRQPSPQRLRQGGRRLDLAVAVRIPAAARVLPSASTLP